MIAVLALLVASLPCVYWTEGIESRTRLEAAGLREVCVPPEQMSAWRAAGFPVRPISQTELASREALPSPGIVARAGLASPTRSPWIVANGWRFVRSPEGKYRYDVPAGKAILAAAEAFAHRADAILKVDPSDVGNIAGMLTFLRGLPPADLPAMADIGVVDDGSSQIGEVMNLLARRNLLFQALPAPSSRFSTNISLGSAEYTREEAADPSAFALKIRRQLTDERRLLRVYGSEVVICRLTGDAGRIRLHLINYGGREIEGLRIRVRGLYGSGEAHVAGAGVLPLEDHAIVEGATEFSIRRIGTYAAVDLRTGR